MSNLDRVLDEAMNLPTEQQEMLIQILQRRAIEQRRDEIACDAQLSLAEFREGKLKIQTAEEAIADLREFIQNDFGAKAYG
jgi:transcriptional regulator with AAA-type ATPase domain